MPIPNFSDHAANERTFLAWVRTALAVVAFGFLVERFDLFLAYLGRAAPNAAAQQHAPHFAFANLAGLTLIGLGMAMIGIATWRFIRIGREIEDAGRIRRLGSRFDVALALLLILLCGALLFYLVQAVTQNA